MWPTLGDPCLYLIYDAVEDATETELSRQIDVGTPTGEWTLLALDALEQSDLVRILLVPLLLGRLRRLCCDEDNWSPRLRRWSFVIELTIFRIFSSDERALETPLRWLDESREAAALSGAIDELLRKGMVILYNSV